MDDERRNLIREEIEKAVVKIITPQGMIGTGFFITRDGYIITAYHCIEDRLKPDQTRFNLEFQFFNGDVRGYEVELEPGSNRATDLALFRISYGPPACLPLGLVDRGNITEDVIAVGYAAGHKEGRELGFYPGKISSFVKQQFEIIRSIQGPGQSGGPIYHYKSNRVVGVAQDAYDSNVMSSAGLALRFDSLFEEWPGLGKINDKTAAVWDKKIGELKTEPDEPGKCGRMIHKLCDRYEQWIRFWSFFAKTSGKCPTRPQFYFIHGLRGEGHESFVRRMIEQHIKEYAKTKWKQENIDIPLKEVRWPGKGELEDRKECLTWGPFLVFDPAYAPPECSLSELQQLCCNSQFVAIYHKIDVSKWKKQDEDLLRWYMGDDCWAGFECDGDIPRFLIFFNIEYPRSKFFDIMTAIRQRLGCYCFSKERIQALTKETAADRCPCHPGIDLEPITLDHLEEWFRDYKDCAKKDPKVIRSIFKRCRNYEEIEEELREIIELHNKELGQKS